MKVAKRPVAHSIRLCTTLSAMTSAQEAQILAQRLATLNKSGSLSRKGRIVEAVMYCSEVRRIGLSTNTSPVRSTATSPQSGLIFPFFPIAGLQ